MEELHDEDGEPRCVRRQRAEHLEVAVVAGDDGDVVVCSERIGGRCYQGVDSRGRRLHPGAHGSAPERSCGVTYRRINGGDVHDVEQTPHVVVVAGVTDQDALGEYGCGQDKVVGPRSEQAQASATLLIDRCEPFDATRVQYGDQPAARCARGGALLVLAAFRLGCTAVAESSHD